MSNNPEMQEKPLGTHHDDPQHDNAPAASNELSEEEQPAMNFQTIMACIVC